MSVSPTANFIAKGQALISLFELFKIGIGPSSSHTVGPMLAARMFVCELSQRAAAQNSREDHAAPEDIERIVVELYGSLALTGLGHHTDRAVIMGLMGEHPESVDPAMVEPRYHTLRESKQLQWLGRFPITFDIERDLVFHRDIFLARHPNGMKCTAYTRSGALLEREYFSIGGGFVIAGNETATDAPTETASPLEFHTAEALLQLCRSHNISIADVVQTNELALRTTDEIDAGLDAIWAVMKASIERGCFTTGLLPGGLKVKRRAPQIHEKLTSCRIKRENPDAMDRMDWVALYALAVNEENAAGGRVVTAPTNGAAGVIPAVIAYYERFLEGANREGIHNFLRTAAAIGMLYKRNASLSAAEMGCQGEVGVACSMAAGGLAAVMGGTPAQIENAAEIGMEHNLGLTCDPVGGLVQVPCIERNTMGAIKAINAARLAVLYGDGDHRVSLDRVIETMRQTGIDMQSKYKETSLGGLAVNVTSC